MTTGQTNSRKECGTLFSATLAAAAFVAARSEASTSLSWLYGFSALFIVVPWLLWFVVRTGGTLGERLNRWLPGWCALWILLPLVSAQLARRQGIGDPLEILMLVCLQNAAMMAAAFSHLGRCQPISCLLSSFLALFAIVIGTSPAVFALAGLFGVLMLWLFMARYWERVHRTVAAEQTESCLPLRSSVLGGVALISLLLLAALGSTQASTHVLRGFMPTSGGDIWSDEFARAGVGDGDAMVAAKEEAMSFGPVESELFLDSDMPTLYDMFNDMYGEPPIPKRKQERNIGLAPSSVKETEQRTATTERNGREFSMLRRKVKQKQATLDDRRAAAMMYVFGRVPLHLALERFDTFDGRQWTHSGRKEELPTIRLENRADKPWAYCLDIGASPVHRGLERHLLKIINLKTNRFPSPPQLTAVHVDKVDQLDFFGWTDDSVVHMPVRDHIPQLTVVHLMSQGMNLEPLRTDFRSFANGEARQAESQMFGDFAEVAENWTRDVPRGWRQVEAVVHRLRQDFMLDPQAELPETCDDAVSHFLAKRRGPDFLFATTAATLLRELGYDTRLVTGFYARPDRFNRRTRQTAVLAEDIHVWVEVHAGGNTWIPIEPTPGYESPAENLTWQQWARSLATQLADWCLGHFMSLIALTIGFTAFVRTRPVWLDLLGRGVCGLLGRQSTAARLRWTIRLLEWRAWLAGCRRPSQQTVIAWYSPLIRTTDADSRMLLEHFFGWSDRLLYSTGNLDVADDHEIARACKAMVSIGRRSAMLTYLKLPPATRRE